MRDDFDPAVFGGLLADDAVEPGTAMAATLADGETQEPGPPKPLPQWVQAAVVVAGLIIAAMIYVAIRQ